MLRLKLRGIPPFVVKQEVRYTGGYPDPLAVELAAKGGLVMVQLATDNG